MTEIARPTPANDAVTSVKQLFDELKEAEAKVRACKMNILAVKAALRPNGKKPAAKKTTPSTNPMAARRRRGLPTKAAAKVLAEASTADEV
jgi:hypothetical protein